MIYYKLDNHYSWFDNTYLYTRSTKDRKTYLWEIIVFNTDSIDNNIYHSKHKEKFNIKDTDIIINTNIDTISSIIEFKQRILKLNKQRELKLFKILNDI